MIRSWIPVTPTPRIGRRVTHVLTIPQPVEQRPLAELKINSKIVKPLEAIGIITIQDLARAKSTTIATIRQVSIKSISSFKRYCSSRGIPVTMTPRAVEKIRIEAKRKALGLEPLKRGKSRKKKRRRSPS